MTIETKPFITLVGSDYYPNKWYDYKGLFDTIEDAVASAKRDVQNQRYDNDWWQVIDLRTMEIAAEGRRE